MTKSNVGLQRVSACITTSHFPKKSASHFFMKSISKRTNNYGNQYHIIKKISVQQILITEIIHNTRSRQNGTYISKLNILVKIGHSHYILTNRDVNLTNSVRKNIHSTTGMPKLLLYKMKQYMQKANTLA